MARVIRAWAINQREKTHLHFVTLLKRQQHSENHEIRRETILLQQSRVSGHADSFQ